MAEDTKKEVPLQLIPEDLDFEPGFNIKTLWAARFVGFIMLPGAIYLGLVTGHTRLRCQSSSSSLRTPTKEFALKLQLRWAAIPSLTQLMRCYALPKTTQMLFVTGPRLELAPCTRWIVKGSAICYGTTSKTRTRMLEVKHWSVWPFAKMKESSRFY